MLSFPARVVHPKCDLFEVFWRTFQNRSKPSKAEAKNFQVKIEINHVISLQIHFNWNDMNPAARGLKNRFQHKLIPLSYV